MDSLKEKIKTIKLNRLSSAEKYLYDIFIELKTVVEYNDAICFKLKDKIVFKYDTETNILWCSNKVFKNYFTLHNMNEYDENFMILKKYINTYLGYNRIRILSIPESLINIENI